MGRFRIAALIALGALALPSAGWAQGCVLCYTSLANGGPGAVRAFQLGVIALLAPVILLCLGIALFIYRRVRNPKDTSSMPHRIGHGIPDTVQLSDSHLGI